MNMSQEDDETIKRLKEMGEELEEIEQRLRDIDIPKLEWEAW